MQVGQNYQEVRRSFSRAVACGIQRADKSLAINPPDDAIFEQGDSIIGLAQTGMSATAPQRPGLQIADSRQAGHKACPLPLTACMCFAGSCQRRL